MEDPFLSQQRIHDLVDAVDSGVKKAFVALLLKQLREYRWISSDLKPFSPAIAASGLFRAS